MENMCRRISRYQDNMLLLSLKLTTKNNEKGITNMHCMHFIHAYKTAAHQDDNKIAKDEKHSNESGK